MNIKDGPGDEIRVRADLLTHTLGAQSHAIQGLDNAGSNQAANR